MRGKAFCDNYKVHGPQGLMVDSICSDCGSPLPHIGVTVDMIVEFDEKIWFVKRNEGWAIPGGFVEYDETLEEAAKRELREELGASKVKLIRQFHTYGDPNRDKRRNVSVVYIAEVDQINPQMEHLEEEGLEEVRGFSIDEIPQLAFDHNKIISDYLACE
jgi:ADP-ribose pyrophosphatase YjhB (NUDIX family)